MKKVLLLIVLLELPSSIIEAQTIYLDIGAGFSSMSAMNNQSFEYANAQMSWQGKFEEMTGKKSDLGFSIISHLEFQLSTLPLSLTAGISYTQLSGGADFVKAQSPVWYSTMYTTGELETQKNILSMRPGVQWAIIPSPVRIFLSLELLYSIFSDTRLKIKNSSGITEGIIEGNTRMGLSFGGGARVGLCSLLDFSIETNYSLTDLISLEVEDEAKNIFSVAMSLHFKFM